MSSGLYKDTPGYMRAVAWVTVTMWSLLHYVVIFLPLAGLAFFFLTGSYWGIAVFVFCVASSLWPTAHWPGFHRIFNHWRPIFDFECIVADDKHYQKDSKYVVTLAPHGVVPLINLMMLGVAEEYLPWLNVKPGVASVVLRLPFFRQMFTWCGSIPVSGTTLKEALKSHSVSCVPGGIAELFLSHPDHEEIYLRKRKGVVRMALENGVEIIPVYLFGQTQFHRQLGHGDTFMARLSRKLRGSLTIFYGRYGTPIPYGTKVLAVVGEPISASDLFAKDCKLSFDDKVNEYHSRWIQAYETIFDQYKERAGPKYSAKKLVIS